MPAFLNAINAPNNLLEALKLSFPFQPKYDIITPRAHLPLCQSEYLFVICVNCFSYIRRIWEIVRSCLKRSCCLLMSVSLPTNYLETHLFGHQTEVLLICRMGLSSFYEKGKQPWITMLLLKANHGLYQGYTNIMPGIYYLNKWRLVYITSK